MLFRRLRHHFKRREARREEDEFFDEWDQQGWDVGHQLGPRLALESDEIEAVCDALWFVESKGGMAREQRALWDRLQPVRHGDYGGTGSIVLTPEESDAVVEALDAAASTVGLDKDEQALRARLRG